MAVCRVDLQQCQRQDRSGVRLQSDGGDGWVSSVLRADFRIYGAANSAAAQCGVLQDLAERKQQDEVSGDRSSGSRILIEFADTQCDQARVRRLWNHEYR